MPIVYNEQSKTFSLRAGNSQYMVAIYGEGHIINPYYGAAIPEETVTANTSFRDLYTRKEDSLFPKEVATAYTPYTGDMNSSFHPMRYGIIELPFSADLDLMEFSGFGTGDFRKSAVRIRYADGTSATDFRYKSHKIYAGKPALEGLPATYINNDNEADTLEITTLDATTGAECDIIYTAFHNQNVITKSYRVRNCGNKPFTIEDLCCTFNLPDKDFEAVSLYGRWARERNIERTPLHHGIQSITSRRGASSHEYNPFLALVRNSDEELGEAYGVNFVYSGSFSIGAEVDVHESTRVFSGFNPEQFAWTLKPGEEFQSPETVMVYSDSGLGGMSRTFHRFYADHLIKGKYKYEKRPLLINCWEGTLFDINEEVILGFAKGAKELGIELLVLDDGWFGKRDNDRSSLGDWFVYEEKFNLQRLVKNVNQLGLKFGIWFEPEMISPDSDLFRAHPDWCLHVDGREHNNCRQQYVLDMSRDEVVENIFEQMRKVLDSTNIEYIKWDFNRNLTEVGSATLPPEKQGELYHRFMLGTYKLMDKLLEAYPHLLLENCSGGGGRFDPGMLYYSPQIWASDNTDCIDRLDIQFGTSMCYPASSMGAHVTLKHRGDFNIKGNVALWGTFGYELNPGLLTEKEKAVITKQVEDYHKYYNLTHFGDLYRLIYPSDPYYCAWELVARDKSEALLTVVVTKESPHKKFRLRMKGLKADAYYKIEETGRIYSGALLMNFGMNLTEMPCGTNDSYKLHFVEIK